MCQRYYEVIGGGANSILVDGYNPTGSNISSIIRYAAEKRATPTTVRVGTWVSGNVGSIVLSSTGTSCMTIYAAISSTGRGYFLTNSTDDVVTVDAEL